MHELRRGKTALVWTDRYYGTVDATPLFLVLLSELWRWSGDDAIVRELEQAARKRARLDRLVRRSRRRRLRRVPAPRLARHRQPELEGLVELDGLPRRLARAGADRAGRGAGLRLRREAAHRRAGTPRLGRRGDCGATRARGGRAARPVRRRVLARGARLVRARPRSRQASGRRARVEHGPPAVERDRSGRARRAGCAAAHVGAALVGVGGPHARRGRGGVRRASSTTTAPSGPTTTR